VVIDWLKREGHGFVHMESGWGRQR
jgi:hypothetical protein